MYGKIEGKRKNGAEIFENNEKWEMPHRYLNLSTATDMCLGCSGQV